MSNKNKQQNRPRIVGGEHNENLKKREENAAKLTFETKMIQPVCLLLIQSTIMTIISVCDLVIPSFQKYFSLSQCGQLLEFS